MGEAAGRGPLAQHRLAGGVRRPGRDRHARSCIFHIEHAAAEAPYWVGVQGRDLFGPTLFEFGTDEQKARFLPSDHRLRGDVGAGLQRAQRRLRPGRPDDQGRARRRRLGDQRPEDLDDVRHHADWLYVLCRTDPNAPKHRGISMLLVPRHQPAWTCAPIRNMAGGAEFGEVFFTMPAPKRTMSSARSNGGWRVVMGTLGNERAGTTVLPFQASFGREMEPTAGRWPWQGESTVDPVVRQRLAPAWAGLRIMEMQPRPASRRRAPRRASGSGVIGIQALLGQLASRASAS